MNTNTNANSFARDLKVGDIFTTPNSHGTSYILTRPVVSGGGTTVLVARVNGLSDFRDSEWYVPGMSTVTVIGNVNG